MCYDTSSFFITFVAYQILKIIFKTFKRNFFSPDNLRSKLVENKYSYLSYGPVVHIYHRTIYWQEAMKSSVSTKMDDEYVLRYEYGNLIENKTRTEGIYHNKRCAQDKAQQDPTCQSLIKHHFSCNVICKQNAGNHKQRKNRD